MRTEYGLYFANHDTGDRHHLEKGTHPDDLARLRRKARWILRDFQDKQGTYYRLHSGWATHLELWEFPPGDHDFMVPPDRRIAVALVTRDGEPGDLDLTPIYGVTLPEVDE